MKILVTGAAGSIGSNLVNALLKNHSVIAFDNNEHGLSLLPNEAMLMVGDLRDRRRLEEATRDVDAVIHCASLKRVDLGESNVNEWIKTNVAGTMNLAESCQQNHVPKLLLISSDKAVPTDGFSTYGATKYLQEKIVLAANGSVARFGNVMGTRGDVLEIWERQHLAGQPLTITDPRMKRFFWNTTDAVAFTLDCLNRMKGGEIFVPKLLVEYNILDFKQQHYPTDKTRVVGIRLGEVLYHNLMTVQEEGNATKYHWGWIINKPQKNACQYATNPQV